MPILDIRPVVAAVDGWPNGLAQAVADRVATALNCPPGRLWVRLAALSSQEYAENHATLDASDLPVFVTVLHAHPPQAEARVAEAMAISRAVAESLGRRLDQVHVEYAAPGAGRIAFGGRLVV